MRLYRQYLRDIDKRASEGLNPKPIDNGKLLNEIIEKMMDESYPDRNACIDFFIYNVTPGTTSGAIVKAQFLKDIILKNHKIQEISQDRAFKLLSHMKGGPSVNVLIDLAFSNDKNISYQSACVLKSQVFLYEADMKRLEKEYKNGNKVAEDILESYSRAEFFTMLPEIDEEIKVVTFVAGIGDISTDFLSPGSDAHSRSDRELHGQSIFEHDSAQQNQLISLQNEHPDKKIMLISDKVPWGLVLQECLESIMSLYGLVKKLVNIYLLLILHQL